MATKNYETKAPTGLTITRNGDHFVAKWKFGDKDYGAGQTLSYATNRAPKWKSIKLSKTAKEKSIVPISEGSIHPSASGKYLKLVMISVTGTRKTFTKTEKDPKDKRKTITVTYKTEMSEPTQKNFGFDKPPKPAVSLALGSNYYTSVLTVNSGGTSSDHYWIRQIVWQTALVKDCDISVSDGAKVKGWDSPHYANQTTYSRTWSESTGTLASGSWTRWYKVWSRGVAGDSDPVYVKHVFAVPNAVKTTNTKVTKSASGYMCRVDWSIDIPARKPVDQTAVQYVIATIDSTLSSWQNASEAAGNSPNGSLTFPIDALIGDDQALYVRVNTKHDNNIAYGPAIRTAIGVLSNPSNLSVTKDDSTYRATITATNNSSVASSFLAVRYMTDQNPTGWDIGIIEHGQTSVTVQCPNWTGRSVKFGVRAVYGSKKQTTRADGAGSYAVTPITQSAQITDGGVIPVAPGNVSANPTDISGTIRVTWNWSWSSANVAEISWSDHADAWESTDEPETYQVNSMHASAWNISGLEAGIVWYIRVRLGDKNGDTVTWGPYSDAEPVDLSSAPIAPVLDLSAGAISEAGDVTVTWTYSTGDGTGQASATLAVVTESGGVLTYTPIEEVQTAQSITINAAEKGWTTGTSYALAVRVTSESNHFSEWSDPVTVYVVEPLLAEITQTSLVAETVVDDGVARDIYSLKSMPMTVTVTGAGNAGNTTIAIERRADYQIDRPDESLLSGYEGETVVLIPPQVGEAQITINRDDLIGRLDDEALYRLVCTVSDSFGQSSTVSRDFEVHWTNQALMPEAQVVADDEQLITKITPIAPDGAATGDTVDIYRLSIDKPVLIYEGAEFGTTYVDPYPTLGWHGGHRIVYKTLDGDYITADGHLAWLDVSEPVDSDYNIIDFGTGRVMLRYNIDLGSSWSKDFKETQYLGGSVQGDWNPAVSRSATMAAAVIDADDTETIEAMRRLAVHPGICHIRTKDGSSYAADVQVSEDRKQATAHKVVTFSLKVTRVDPEEMDGMTLAEWNDLHDEV